MERLSDLDDERVDHILVYQYRELIERIEWECSDDELKSSVVRKIITLVEHVHDETMDKINELLGAKE